MEGCPCRSGLSSIADAAVIVQRSWRSTPAAVTYDLKVGLCELYLEGAERWNTLGDLILYHSPTRQPPSEIKVPGIWQRTSVVQVQGNSWQPISSHAVLWLRLTYGTSASGTGELILSGDIGRKAAISPRALAQFRSGNATGSCSLDLCISLPCRAKTATFATRMST
jgi:hypothetical protein